MAKEAYATKIEIDNSNKATAVQFTKNHIKYSIRAKKEIILSAGSPNSAKLLMLSGIGPKNHLQSLGIPVKKDLKVGQNLQEHVSFGAVVFTVNDTITIVDKRLNNNPKTLSDYLFFHKGPFTLAGGSEGVAFMTYPGSNSTVPDVEIVQGAGSLCGDTQGALRKMVGLPENVANAVCKGVVDSFSLVTILLRPESRGEVKLRDADPYSPPLLYHGFFTDKNNKDIKGLIQGTRMVWVIFSFVFVWLKIKDSIYVRNEFIFWIIEVYVRNFLHYPWF